MPGVGACGAASRELPVAVDFCLAIGLGFSLVRNPRFFGGLSTQAWFPCSDGWAVFSAAASPLSSDRRHHRRPRPLLVASRPGVVAVLDFIASGVVLVVFLRRPEFVQCLPRESPRGKLNASPC